LFFPSVPKKNYTIFLQKLLNFAWFYSAGPVIVN
jgi:hypothetical protein